MAPAVGQGGWCERLCGILRSGRRMVESRISSHEETSVFCALAWSVHTGVRGVRALLFPVFWYKKGVC